MKKETLRDAMLMLDEDMVLETMEKRAELEAINPRKKKTPVRIIGRVAAIAAAAVIFVIGGAIALQMMVPLGSNSEPMKDVMEELGPNYGEIIKEQGEGVNQAESTYVRILFEAAGAIYEIDWNSVLSKEDARSFETLKGKVRLGSETFTDSLEGSIDDNGNISVRRFENGDLYGLVYGKWYAAKKISQ